MTGTQTPPAASPASAPPAAAPRAGGGRDLVAQLGGPRNVALGAAAVGVVTLGLYKRGKAKKSASSSPALAGTALGFVPSSLSDVATDPSQVYTGYDQLEQQIQAILQQMNERTPNPNPVPRPIPGGPIQSGPVVVGPVGPIPGMHPPVQAHPPTPAPAPPQQQTYTVKKGDTLWGIAAAKLGNPLDWRQIYQDNKATIGNNPDLIYPGERLHIP